MLRQKVHVVITGFTTSILQFSKANSNTNQKHKQSHTIPLLSLSQFKLRNAKLTPHCNRRSVSGHQQSSRSTHQQSGFISRDEEIFVLPRKSRWPLGPFSVPGTFFPPQTLGGGGGKICKLTPNLQCWPYDVCTCVRACMCTHTQINYCMYPSHNFVTFKYFLNNYCKFRGLAERETFSLGTNDVH